MPATGYPGMLAGAALFERALSLHEQTPDAFEAARTGLAFGQRLRRSRNRLRCSSVSRRSRTTSATSARGSGFTPGKSSRNSSAAPAGRLAGRGPGDAAVRIIS
ncbi:MAG TPA: hypothetical protein VGD91_09740 [Trebonia sp.]